MKTNFLAAVVDVVLYAVNLGTTVVRTLADRIGVVKKEGPEKIIRVSTPSTWMPRAIVRIMAVTPAVTPMRVSI
jgi:hypothetical protein